MSTLPHLRIVCDECFARTECYRGLEQKTIGILRDTCDDCGKPVGSSGAGTRPCVAFRWSWTPGEIARRELRARIDRYFPASEPWHGLTCTCCPRQSNASVLVDCIAEARRIP